MYFLQFLGVFFHIWKFANEKSCLQQEVKANLDNCAIENCINCNDKETNLKIENKTDNSTEISTNQITQQRRLLQAQERNFDEIDRK